jgi:hypothetical protein
MSEQETADQILAKLNAQVEIARAEIVEDFKAMAADGREMYADWDEAIGYLNKTVGEQTTEAIGNLARRFAAAPQLLYRIGHDEELAKRFAGMTEGQAMAELAAMQTTHAPNTSQAGAFPWKDRAKGNDARSLYDDNLSDADFYKILKRQKGDGDGRLDVRKMIGR